MTSSQRRPAESHDDSRARTLAFFHYFIRAYPGRTAVMVALMVVAGIAESFGVLTLVPIIELLSSDQPDRSRAAAVVFDTFGRVGLVPTLGTLLGLMVVLMSLKAAVLFVALRQVGFSTAQLAEDLRLRFIRGMLYARWGFFGRRTMGQYATAVIGEVTRTSAAYREGSQFVAAFIQILAYLAISFVVSWRITLATIMAGGAISVLVGGFIRRSRAAGAAQSRHNRALMGRFLDVLQGMKALKAMGREELAWPLLKSETQSVTRAQKKAVVASESRNVIFEPLMTALLALGLFVLVGVQGRPLSQVLVLVFIFYRVMQNINQLQLRYQSVATGESAFYMFLEDVEAAEAEREVRQPAEMLHQGPVAIALRDVWFSYDEALVLRGVELRIPPGAFVTVAGESGSGKTTLADVLVGLVTPQRGEVLIDGEPLGSIELEAWRKSIGYVPQEMLVFNDTIHSNVTLGDPTLSASDVERALRLAGAWEFVQQRPAGLNDRIGERGAGLSGGQRQRIALARALVRRPSLLVLDEVTTALDPDTEQAICSTLRELAGHVTIFAISHQPALQRVADISYVMRNGRLEEADAPLVSA